MPQSDNVIDSCLNAIAQAHDDDAVFRVVGAYRRQLLGDPGISRRLVNRAVEAASDDTAQPALYLLERALDEARMDVSGSGSRGHAFLEAAEEAVADAVRTERISFRMAVQGCSVFASRVSGVA